MSLSVCVTAYAETTPYGEVSEAAVSSSETIAEKADALKCYSLSDPDALQTLTVLPAETKYRKPSHF